MLVHHARRALGDPGLITTGAGGYAFTGGEGCLIDVEEFRRKASAGRAALAAEDWAGALGSFTRALGWWRGEPLAEDAYADWARPVRAELARLHLEALEGAAAGAITVGAAAEYSAPVGAPNHSDGVYLAFFSSRGPTVDGRTKPDVTAPGVSITAAQAGTTAGYATYSGTSMATPFVSGTVALMLALRPAWGPAEVRSAVEGTARDRGPTGKDVDWGAGVLDGYAAVAAAAGSSGASAFPAHVRVTGSVPDGGTWSYPFSVTDLSTPIAATLIIDGARVCVFPWVFGCLAYEWSPDLDAELRDPTGAVIAASTCAAGSECGIGRQETLHAMPTAAGTYTIVVYPYAGDPNAGKGGSFSIDLSTGPVGTGTPPPPPPPTPTMHVGDLDGAGAKVKSGWRATVTVVVHDEGHSALAGVTVSGIWSYGTAASCVTGGDGACSLTSKKLSNRTASVSFSVSGLSKDGYVDAPSANHDVDGGTDGTTVTVTKPA